MVDQLTKNCLIGLSILENSTDPVQINHIPMFATQYVYYWSRILNGIQKQGCLKSRVFSTADRWVYSGTTVLNNLFQNWTKSLKRNTIKAV